MKRIAALLLLALAGWAQAGTLGLQAGLITGYSRPVLPKVERGGSSVIHLTWETKL